MGPSRNSPCPCGSGRKYKRCCFAEAELAAREARFDNAVGQRIREWASQTMDDQLGLALEQFAAPNRAMTDGDLELFATWFHNDRELPGGGTPAERYAARTDLPARERATAARIATARPGLHRVLAVEPGSWIVLEDVLDGTRIRVRSPHASRGVVRWDLVLGRVMDGDPPSLWGAMRSFEPSDETELIAELRRLAGAGSEERDAAVLSRTLREHALQLARFVPPAWKVEPSFHTLEGDPVAHGSATWRIHDLAAVSDLLRRLGGLRDDDVLEIDITAPREQLVRRRPELPSGALVIQSGPTDDLDRVSIATLRIERSCLHAETISEQRLDQVIEIVALDFGDHLELVDREVVPVERALEEHRSAPTDIAPLTADERGLTGIVLTDRLRRWLDEPHPLLEGRTPRDAAASDHRTTVLGLLRSIENQAERACRRGEAFADVTWIRRELGVESEVAA
jgi:hypothetical protein